MVFYFDFVGFIYLFIDYYYFIFVLFFGGEGLVLEVCQYLFNIHSFIHTIFFFVYSGEV